MSNADLGAWRPAVLVAALLLGACAGEQSLNATTVLSYDQCQGIDAGLTRVDYAQVAGIRGSTLLDMSRRPAAMTCCSSPFPAAASRPRATALRWRTPGAAMVLL